jgi:hypothetical protein
MVCKDGKEPVYIAPCGLVGINYTTDRAKAEVWAYTDTISHSGNRIKYFQAVTKMNFEWEEIKP